MCILLFSTGHYNILGTESPGLHWSYSTSTTNAFGLSSFIILKFCLVLSSFVVDVYLVDSLFLWYIVNGIPIQPSKPQLAFVGHDDFARERECEEWVLNGNERDGFWIWRRGVNVVFLMSLGRVSTTQVLSLSPTHLRKHREWVALVEAG